MENHPASSKKCPIFIKEQTIQKVRAEKGVSFPEAKRLVEQTCFVHTARSYSAAVKKVCSVSVQTDLTWIGEERKEPSSLPSSPVTHQNKESVSTQAGQPQGSHAQVASSPPLSSSISPPSSSSSLLPLTPSKSPSSRSRPPSPTATPRPPPPVLDPSPVPTGSGFTLVQGTKVSNQVLRGLIETRKNKRKNSKNQENIVLGNRFQGLEEPESMED